jgi:hypothetical protein
VQPEVLSETHPPLTLVGENRATIVRNRGTRWIADEGMCVSGGKKSGIIISPYKSSS